MQEAQVSSLISHSLLSTTERGSQILLAVPTSRKINQPQTQNIKIIKSQSHIQIKFLSGRYSSPLPPIQRGKHYREKKERTGWLFHIFIMKNDISEILDLIRVKNCIAQVLQKKKIL